MTTLAITDAKSLTVSNSLAFAGTDGTTMTFPASSTTLAGLGIAQTFSATQTFADGSNWSSSGISIASGKSITPDQAAGIIGTTTNNAANAGSVGEFVSASVTSPGVVVVGPSTAADICSVSLTAGDWDLEAVGSMSGTPSGVFLQSFWISPTSATDPGAPNNGAYTTNNNTFDASHGSISMATGRMRASISSTTTYYLSGKYAGGTGNLSFLGFLSARRVR